MIDGDSQTTYLAFCDETHYNVGRVRGLGMVSAPVSVVALLDTDMLALLTASSVAECKWEKVRSARAGFAAAKLLSWTLGRAQEGLLRVDTLTWQAENAAQRVAAVPYRARLRQMYLRLLGDVLLSRWPAGARFMIMPDEQGLLAWEELAGSLPHVERIAPCRSQDQPLIQLADLFAGLAAYSRDRYTTYDCWLSLPLDVRAAAAELSAADRIRCRLLDDFFTDCKYRHFGVSLRTNWGLRTYDAAVPLGFWWAEEA
jgi:Protein of unknown function (DUF3800)